MNNQIEDLIKKDFHPDAQNFVQSILSKVYENEWGVGKDQLVLSLLKLSNGSVDKLLTYFPIIDPRDIIMEATY